MEIASYICEQWLDYRFVTTKDSQKTEQVFHTEWIRDTWYFHVSYFYKSSVGAENIQDSLHLFFGCTKVQSQLDSRIQTFASTLPEQALHDFFAFVDMKWKHAFDALPQFVRGNVDAMRKDWLLDAASA